MHLYLQHPIWIDTNVPYENPHYYQPQTSDRLEGDLSVVRPIQQAGQASATPQSMVEKVFQTLERENPLQQTEQDARVETKLLPYVILSLPLAPQFTEYQVATSFNIKSWFIIVAYPPRK